MNNSLIIDKHPIRDITLTFNPNNHSYIDNLSNQYTSVTTLISNNFEKFDSDRIATACAIKRKVSKELLLAQWKKIGDDAAYKGHIIHNILFRKFKNETIQYDTDILKEYKNQIEIIYKEISNKLDVVYLEKIIFDPDKLISGMCDSVFITKNKDKYVVIDWKTSKEIQKDNKYNKHGFNQYSHLPDCNYVHYSLQLKMYSEILKSQGYLKYNIPIIEKIVHIAADKTKSYDIYI